MATAYTTRRLSTIHCVLRWMYGRPPIQSEMIRAYYKLFKRFV